MWQRLARVRKAGALPGAGFAATPAGPPPGGPWSPRLANLLRAGRAPEWETRGHRVVRDADAGTISVSSARAGARVLARVTRERPRQWTLGGQAAHSAGDRPWRRAFWGVSLTGRPPQRRPVSVKALQACTPEIRRRTPRPRGAAWPQVVQEVRRYVTGWDADVGWADATAGVKELDAWGRRRRRCALWQPWGRRRSRELRHRGGRRDRAWHTTTSAPGAWRVSRRPARTEALPGGYVDGLGVPRVSQRPRR